MKLKQKDKAVLRHEDELAKFLDLGGVKYTDIVDKINAFDWLDIQLADSREQMAIIVLRLYESFNFKVPEAYSSIVLKAFAHKFEEAAFCYQSVTPGRIYGSQGGGFLSWQGNSPHKRNSLRG